MFEPFEGNYVWNLSVNIALALGAEIGEVVEMNRPVLEAARHGADEGTQAFFKSWCGKADQLVASAKRNEIAGHLLSASSQYHRACVYYMIAERMQSRGFAEGERAYQAMLEAMTESARLGGLNCERVEIPYQDTSFPGLLVKAQSVDGSPAPCMVHTNGLDSVKEMIYWSGIAEELAKRGISTLMIDHPGVGEAIRLRGLKGVYDSEQWGTAAYEYLVSLEDIRADAIGVMGWSLGGYYAPRIAAFEPRFALCVSWGANHLWGELQKRRLEREGENPVPHYWEHVMWVFGKDNLDEFITWAENMTLDGVIERIRVPYLVTHGENDRQIPLHNAHRSFEQAINSPKRDLKIFTRDEGGVEHVSADNMAPAKCFISDWIADTFAELRD